MKVLKGFVTGTIAIAAAVVTLSSSLGQAQDFSNRDHQGMDRDRQDRPDRDRPGRGRPPQRRVEFLGTTGLVGKTRIETREVYVGAERGEYRGLEFVARDDDFEITRMTIYFGNGSRRDVGGAKLSENGRVRLDFQNYRRIDSIVIQGRASNIIGSKAQLEVYGRP
jgi:hypothetical protein